MRLVIGLLIWSLISLVPSQTLLFAGTVTPAPMDSQLRYRGLSLEKALEHLRSLGLNIIYSSRLVKPGMRVKSEPVAVEPRGVLDELLAQNGLKVKEGPGGSLLVVKADKSTNRVFQISGVVLAQVEQTPLVDVRVFVPGTPFETYTDQNGGFLLVLPEPGSYVLSADMAGYLPIRQDVKLSLKITGLKLELPPLATIIEELVVIPSAYPLLSRGPDAAPLLSSREINRLPRITNDLFRALSRLPSSSGGDISARFRVRGGEQNEVGVILDGLEIYDPFHLKDLQSVFSVFDSNTIGYVNFIAGGYPAKYGNRMSAVIDMETKRPEEKWKTEVGANFFNGHVLSSDTFHDGRGEWLVSIRRGFLDLARAVENPVALNAEQDESFDFNDGRARFGYAFNEHISVAINALQVDDNIHFNEVETLFGSGRIADVENALLRYQDRYLWANVDIAVNDRLSFDTVISHGSLDRRRTGRQDRQLLHSFDVDDQRSFSFQGFRQDWGFSLSDRHFLQWGAGFKRFEADYDYHHQIFETSPLVTMGGPAVITDTNLDTAPEGNQIHFYASHRVKVFKPLAVEVGVRYDRQSYIPGDPDQISPRINFNWDLGPNTVFKGGWGRVYQAQGIHELRVSDGEDRFHEAQQARHQVVSLEHRRGGWFLKLDAYRKEMPDPRIRYENNFKPVAFFPEAEPDRAGVTPEKSSAEGIEFFIKNNPDKKLNFWLGYAFGRAEDVIDGEVIPRNWDQRHAFQLGLNMKVNRRWTVNLAGNYRDGRPITPVDATAVLDENGVYRAVPILGERNSKRLPDFRRVDLRTTYFKPFWRGGLTTFLEVANVFNSRNVCCVDYEFHVSSNGEVAVIEDQDNWMPFVPSLGVTFQF